MKEYKAFVYMYYAVDAVYNDEPSEVLREYLSDLNPFLFVGEGSADPAEYEEFKEAYLNFFGELEPSALEIYNFCCRYLSENAPREVLEAFLEIEKNDWINVFENNDI